MSSKWDGKSKGNKFGYLFFVYTIKFLGLKATYLFLRLVTFYYYLFSPSRKHLLDFYKNALAYSFKESKKLARKNYYIFGQSLVDRFAFLMGKHKEYTHNSIGGDNLKNLVKSGKGAILMSAHVGNWELAGNFLKGNYNAKVNVLMYQADAEKLTELFNTVTGGVSFNIIAIKNDLSHIIKIHSALSKNEFVCLHADRNMPGAKTLEADFFGKKAKFPQGPFQMASKFNAPVCFVYNVKKTNFHYQLSCSKPIEGKFSAEEILKKYINTFEEKTKENPTQWFNFYNFFN